MPTMRSQGSLTVLEIDIENKRALTGLMKIANSVQLLERKLRLAKKATRDLEGAQSGLGKRMLDSIKNYATFVTGAGGALFAVRMVSAEWDRIINMQERHKNTQLTMNTARMNLRTNLFSLTPEQHSEANQLAMDIARRTNTDPIMVTNGLSVASSAEGFQNFIRAGAAVESIARVSPHNQADFGGMAGAVLDISKAFQIRNPEFKDPNLALGAMMATKGLSRVVLDKQLAKNVPMGMIGIAEHGGDPIFGLALQAAISSSFADIKMEQTANAGIMFVSRLSKFFRDPDKASMSMMTREQKTKERLRKKLFSSFTGDDVFDMENINFLRENPMARAFVEQNVQFETKPEASMLNMIRPGTRSGATLDFDVKSLENTLKDTNHVLLLLKQFMETKVSDPTELTARMQRGFDSQRQKMQIENTTGGLSGVLRDGLKGVLSDADVNVIEQKIGSYKYDISTRAGQKDLVDSTQRVLRGSALKIRMGDNIFKDALGFTPIGAAWRVGKAWLDGDSYDESKLTIAERRNVKALDDTANMAGFIYKDFDAVGLGIEAAPGSIGMLGGVGPAGISGPNSSSDGYDRVYEPGYIADGTGDTIGSDGSDSIMNRRHSMLRAKGGPMHFKSSYVSARARNERLARSGSNSVQAKLARMRVRGRHVSDRTLLSGDLTAAHERGRQYGLPIEEMRIRSMLTGGNKTREWPTWDADTVVAPGAKTVGDGGPNDSWESQYIRAFGRSQYKHHNVLTGASESELNDLLTDVGDDTPPYLPGNVSAKMIGSSIVNTAMVTGEIVGGRIGQVIDGIQSSVGSFLDDAYGRKLRDL